MNSDYGNLYERVRHLENIAVWSVDLQAQRIENADPSDSQFFFRIWMDYHFLIVELSRLRATAFQLTEVGPLKEKIELSLADFDYAFPWLRDLRNVVAHFDEYPIGKGNNKEIRKEGTEVAVIGPDRLSWLDYEIHPQRAVAESAKLFEAILDCGYAFKSNRP